VPLVPLTAPKDEVLAVKWLPQFLWDIVLYSDVSASVRIDRHLQDGGQTGRTSGVVRGPSHPTVLSSCGLGSWSYLRPYRRFDC
jgi:hypothetical protein